MTVGLALSCALSKQHYMAEEERSRVLRDVLVFQNPMAVQLAYDVRSDDSGRCRDNHLQGHGSDILYECTISGEVELKVPEPA